MKASLTALFVLVITLNGAALSDEKTLAKEILDATGVKGGLIVHIGCGDGRLTAALRAGENFIVHGLDTTPANIRKAREYIQSLGLYGAVSVDHWNGRELPYIENLVNLVVSENLGEVPMDEVMRVLAPNGVAYIKKDGKWTKTVKQRPKEMDEWTHYLHDSTNNAVSRDSLIGPPRHFQWIGSPRWSRHHDRMASMSALVSSGGRIFYIMDEGPRFSILLPSKWFLIARDAFNGTILWKRPIEHWHTHLWPFKSGPAQLPRRLIAVKDKVYVTLGIDAPLTALDAATGKTIRTYDRTKFTEEIIFSNGVLFAQVRDFPTDWEKYIPTSRNVGESKRRVGREFPWNEKERKIVAIEADTGKILWEKECRIVPLTLTADEKHVLFHDGESVVCLNRENGEQLWRSEPVSRKSLIPTCFGPTLVAYKDVVLFAGGDKTMTALSAETGKTLWKGEHRRGGHCSPEDLLVIADLAWSGSIAGGKDPGIFTGYDIHTGEVKSEFPPDIETYWFHHRCYRSRATEKYILSSRTGIEFIDFRAKHWIINHWVRGGCLYGIMPANGLIYAPPHDCACYLIAKLYGFNALAAESPSRRAAQKPSDAPRLERGSAYGESVKAPATYEKEWSTYRHDCARSGYTKVAVPAKLKRAWEAKVGGKLTALTIADDKVFVASVDTHTLYALDASTGEPVWRYTAGGRIDSPPTIYRGRVLFGCADGWVYCLRASDGELIWRFRAAPRDMRLMSFEQLESVWSAHGSVLLHDGIVYCVAGRSMFLDGGMRLVRLDAETGKLLSETILDERDPETGESLQAKIQGLNMPPALPDILSCDGKYVYMRSQKFNLEGKRTEVVTPLDPADQKGEGAHLFCPTGFLDGSWFHRSYWIYGKTPLSGAGGYYRAGHFAPAGRILTFDDEYIYGYGRKPEYFRWTTPLEYHLFRIRKEDYEVEVARPRGGKASCIAVSKSPSLNPTGKPLTVEAWVKAKKPDGVVLAHGGPAHGYALILKGGKPQFVIRVKSQVAAVTADQVVTGKWAHLVGVLTDDKKLQIYVDGKLSGSADAPDFIDAEPAQPMQIGADLGGSVGEYESPFQFTGIIDEVRIYHRALTAEEISNHFASPDRIPAKDKELVLYFSFNHGASVDHSGHGNDGTIQGPEAVEGKIAKGMKFAPTQLRKLPFRYGKARVIHDWTREIPLFVRAMVKAGETLFIAGPPDIVNEEEAFDNLADAAVQKQLAEQVAAWQGSKGGLLWAVSPENGETIAEYKLDTLPVWDGMAAAKGRLYLSTTDGRVLCFSGAP